MKKDFHFVPYWVFLTIPWSLTFLWFVNIIAGGRTYVLNEYIQNALGLNSWWSILYFVVAYHLTFRGRWRYYAAGIVFLVLASISGFFISFDNGGLIVLVACASFSILLTVFGALDFFITRPPAQKKHSIEIS